MWEDIWGENRAQSLAKNDKRIHREQVNHTLCINAWETRILLENRKRTGQAVLWGEENKKIDSYEGNLIYESKNNRNWGSVLLWLKNSQIVLSKRHQKLYDSIRPEQAGFCIG